MTEPTMIFFSYSSKDKLLADKICTKLEKAGLACWMAPKSIQPGANWPESIVKGIEAANYFLLLFTENSNNSKHVVREMERADSLNIPILPFKYGEFEPSTSMQYFLSSNQWITSDKDNFDDSINSLVKQLAGKIIPDDKPIKSEEKVDTRKSIAEDKKSVKSKELKSLPVETNTNLGFNKNYIIIALVVLILVVVGVTAMFNGFKSESTPIAVDSKPVAADESITDKTTSPERKQNDLQSEKKSDVGNESNNATSTKKPAVSSELTTDQSAIIEVMNTPILVENLNSLSDPAKTFAQKNVLKRQILTQFSDKTAKVNVMLQGRLDESLTIDQFVDDLISLQNTEVNISEVKKDDIGKILSINVETDK